MHFVHLRTHSSPVAAFLQLWHFSYSLTYDGCSLATSSEIHCARVKERKLTGISVCTVDENLIDQMGSFRFYFFLVSPRGLIYLVFYLIFVREFDFRVLFHRRLKKGLKNNGLRLGRAQGSMQCELWQRCVDSDRTMFVFHVSVNQGWSSSEDESVISDNKDISRIASMSCHWHNFRFDNKARPWGRMSGNKQAFRCFI